MNQYTIYETGERKVLAKGQWNSPRDAYRANSAYWVFLPDTVSIVDSDLRMGEWDLFAGDVIPDEYRTAADQAFERANRKQCPWLY